jgi:hypothetical protein
MSAVMTMSPGPACSAIQSSTAPKSGFTINSTNASAGTRWACFATTLTHISLRLATQ